MSAAGLVSLGVRLPTEVEGSFDAFFAAGYPPLVRVLVGVTGRRPLAEEVAQEAMMSAFQRWDRVSGLDRPDLWVRRVALNRAVSLRRRASAEVRALVRVKAVHPATTVTDAEPLDDALWIAVRRLSRHQMLAITLSSVEQLTAEEIGEILGCSAESARTHLRRARERLATWLKERDDE